MQLKLVVRSSRKIGYFAFCKLFSRFMSRCPFSGVELRGKCTPKSFGLLKIRVKILKIRVQRFRHVCLLLGYLTYLSEKNNIFDPVLMCT